MPVLFLFIFSCFFSINHLRADTIQSIDVITGQWTEDVTDGCFFGLEVRRVFYGGKDHKTATGWWFSLPDLFEQEIPRRPFGHEKLRSSHDKKHRLASLSMCDREIWQEVLHVERAESKTEQRCTLTSATGDCWCYTLRPSHQGWLLEKVEKNGLHQASYYYQRLNNQLLMHEQRLEAGDWTRLDYDRKTGKVVTVWTSSDKGASYVVASRFTYLPAQTEVVDHEGKSRHYHFDPRGLVTKLEMYRADGTLYHQEFREWSSEGALISRTTVDSRHRLFTQKYDSQGRLIEEIYPSVEGEAGSWTRPSLRYHYHEKEIQIIDPYGKSYRQSDEAILPELWANQEANQAASPADEITYVEDGQGQLFEERKQTLDGSTILITRLDALDRPIQKLWKDAQGCLLKRQTLRYDLVGRRLEERIENEQGSITHALQWRYNSDGALTEETQLSMDGPPQTTKYLYNPQGQLIQCQKPSGITLHYTFDTQGQLIQLTSSDGTIQDTFTYNPEGHIEATHSPQVTLERLYNVHKQVTQERWSCKGQSWTLHFSYDALGRKTSIQLPDDTTIHTVFDKARLINIIRCDAKGYEKYRHTYLSHNDHHQPLSAQTALQGPTTSWQWNADKRLTSIATDAFEEHVSFDANKRVHTRHSHWRQKETQETFTYNPLGELPSPPQETPPAYDVDGRIINQGPYTYHYDALDRLIAVYKAKSLCAEYLYDPLHRRIYSWEMGKECFYLYDGAQDIGCINATGTLEELRLLGYQSYAEAGATVAMELHGQLLLPIHDTQGSIVGLVDPKTGSWHTKYHYSAFGQCFVEKEEIASPWRYLGKRHDTLTELTLFGRRYLAPHLGQWITKDPARDLDGPDRYAFVHNDPLNRCDPYGMADVVSYLFPNMQEARLWYRRRAGRAAEGLVGDTFLKLSGYYSGVDHSGVMGCGEANDLVRVTFINGALTDYSTFVDHASALSQCHGGVNIHYVHSPSRGWSWDMLRAFSIRFGYLSHQSYELVALWRQMFQEMGGIESGGIIIHYCHSIGVVDTLHALSLLSEAERKCIRVFAFGSPSLDIGPRGSRITHIVSWRDGVCFLDAPTLLALRDDPDHPALRMVGSRSGIPFIDHLFSSPSYQEIWRRLGGVFVETHGNVAL